MEKLLVTSNFSFSHNVFYSYMYFVCQNAALCGNGFRFQCKCKHSMTQTEYHGSLNACICTEIWKQLNDYDQNSKMQALPKPFPKKVPVLTFLQYKSFENTVGKGEIARDKQFLLFPQCFPPVWRIFCHFHQIWNCRLETLWAISPFFHSNFCHFHQM